MKLNNIYTRRIILTLLLVIGIGAAFFVFLKGNSERIDAQNEEYLYELTTQRASSIDKIITENLSFITSISYLYGQSLDSPQADVDILREYENNTVFDLLRFIDSTGDDYTSNGVLANLADRSYFQDGMKGGSGITYVLASKVTGERQIGFYAPVRYEGRIIGVMVGFYGEEYIRNLLEFELFGAEGICWLCTRDGTIIGTTEDYEYDNFFDLLSAKGSSDSQISSARAGFAAGDKAHFTYQSGRSAETCYAVGLQASDWVIVRDFPAEASEGIISRANGNGIRLLATLVVLFALYVAALIIDFIMQQRRMRKANVNANYVSRGVTRLFEKFMTLDLDTGRYEYIVGVPNDSSMPAEGDYSDYCSKLLGLITDEKNHDEVRAFVDIDNLREILSTSDTANVRAHIPNGEEEWYTYNFIVIERADALPKLLLVVSQDVTAMHNKEVYEQARLQEALDTAENASRAKTEFLFNMSHDLRTPMNAIIGYTELAERHDLDSDTMRSYMGKIDTAGKQLLALINDILEMSRIESGKMTIDPEPGDITAAFSEVRDIFRSQMDSKGIAFSVDCDDVADRWVCYDRHRLDRVLMNLVSNAYKFTGEGGTVSLSLIQIGSVDRRASYEIRVRDNGIGMSKEFASRLFTPFERERTSTVSGIQGTGLGLSITKRIVDMMGGSIDVITEQGKGTEFIIRLTFDIADNTDEQNSSALTRTDEPAVLAFSGKRVLLAEDNAINREIAVMILTDAGFACETAVNGREAVDMVLAAEPGYYDAVLMDIQMPEMNGYEATAAIRSMEGVRASIPIIAMTANAFKEDVDAAISAGMNGHVAKPIDIDAMMDTLTEVLTAGR